MDRHIEHAYPSVARVGAAAVTIWKLGHTYKYVRQYHVQTYDDAWYEYSFAIGGPRHEVCAIPSWIELL